MRKIVKAMLCMVAVLMVTPAIAQESDTWPWDFPKKVKISLAEGQTVLSPYTYYPEKIKNKEPLQDAVLIFYDTTVEKVGEETSVLANYGNDVEIPNALIIPLPQKAKAKKGDIVLTWWQSGSGMQRAIVVDDSNPAEPKVCYLDMTYPDNPDSPKLEEKRKGESLKPASFTVLKDGQWQSGAQVAMKKDDEWRKGVLIHAEGDKVLVLGFGSKIEIYNKADVRIIPFKEKIKVGDKVFASWVSYYRPGYIVAQIDSEIGRVYVKKEGSDNIESRSITEVTKVL